MIEQVSPGSLQSTKRQIYTDLHRDVGTSVKESETLLRDMMKQKDYAEAVSAYLEKRQAHWLGE
jgi:enoyl-CoA hydratase/carnithine racemase